MKRLSSTEIFAARVAALPSHLQVVGNLVKLLILLVSAEGNVGLLQIVHNGAPAGDGVVERWL